MPKTLGGKFRRKLLVTYIILITVPVILALVLSLNFVAKNIQNQTNKNIQQIISLVTSNLEYEHSKVVELSNVIHNNTSVQEILSISKDVSYSDFQGYALQLRKEFENILVAGSNNKISIIYKDGSAFSGFNSEELLGEREFWYNITNDKETIDEYINDSKNSRWLYNIDKNGNKYLVFIRKIAHRISGEHIGSVAVYYDMKRISGEIQNISIGESGFLFLTDENGNIVLYGNEKFIFDNVNNEEYIEKILSSKGVFEMNIQSHEYQFVVKTLTLTSWKIVGVMSKQEFSNNKLYMTMFFGLIGLIAIGLAVLASISLSKSFTVPINALYNGMQQAESGNLNVAVDYKNSDDELSYLSEGFNNMIHKIKHQIEEIKEKERSKRIADIKVLYEQINPHFLYNTLDSINWLATTGKDNGKVSDMVSSLANMLRLGLSKGHDIIKVKDEIEHLNCYIDIQKIRFDNSFTVEYDIDKNVLQESVMKMFLQPLVENAIIHGFVDSDYCGKIIVSAKKHNNTLVFAVEDNGIGTDIETLNKKINIPNGKTTGYGLYNIQQRIRLYYGENWGLKAMESDLSGIKIEVTLPASLYGEEVL